MKGGTVIYALCAPDGEIRYIGKTMLTPERRLICHLAEAAKLKGRGPRRCHWIRSLAPAVPKIRPLLVVPDDFGAEMERRVIARFRSVGHRLTNLTDGGDGTPGRIPSAETRAKAAASNRGKKRSPEFCAKMRGRTFTPESRAKMSASQRGRKLSPERLARLRAVAETRRGAKRSPQTCARIRAAKIEQAASARARNRMVCEGCGVSYQAKFARKPPQRFHSVACLGATRKGIPRLSPEHKARLSLAVKARWQREKEKRNVA